MPLKPNQSEVLILSYEILRLHVKVINNARQIGILVVDEGHRLKNTSGSQILTALNFLDVEVKILITGTPIQVRILLSGTKRLSNSFVALSHGCSVDCVQQLTEQSFRVLQRGQLCRSCILGDLSNFRKLYERPMAQANQTNESSV